MFGTGECEHKALEFFSFDTMKNNISIEEIIANRYGNDMNQHQSRPGQARTQSTVEDGQARSDADILEKLNEASVSPSSSSNSSVAEVQAAHKQSIAYALSQIMPDSSHDDLPPAIENAANFFKMLRREEKEPKGYAELLDKAHEIQQEYSEALGEDTFEDAIDDIGFSDVQVCQAAAVRCVAKGNARLIRV